MRPDELEAVVGQTLAELPAPRAPETLLPRVMAAVAAWAERPWYTRAWLTWPLAMQLASAAALALLVGVASFAMAHLAGGAGGILAAYARDLGAAGVAVQTIASAFDILWRGIVEPVAPYAFAVVMTMCAACGALGAALNQIVMGRTAHR